MEYTQHLTEKAFKAKVASWHAHIEGSHRKLLLRRVFTRMDVDGSGSVSLEEFRALVTDGAGAPGDAASADLFRWIEGAEGDGDGELTVDEWVPWVLEQEAGKTDDEFQMMVDEMLLKLARKRRETLLRQVFLKMDIDSSGTIDRAEFENLTDGSAEASRQLSTIYGYLDAEFGDSDGELSMDEWVQGMKSMGEDMDDFAFEAEVSKWMAALAKNQRRMWRAVFAKGQAYQFVVAARAAGATHALFVQPAHTIPPDTSSTSEVPPANAPATLPIAPPTKVHGPPPADVPNRRPNSGGPLKPLAVRDMNPRAASANVSRSISKESLHVSNSTPALQIQDPAGLPPPVPVSTQDALMASEPQELTLSHRGTAQCMLARLEWFGRLPVRKMILTSPAICAKQTALHVSGRLDEAEKLKTEGSGGGEVAAELEADSTASASPLQIIEKLAPEPLSTCAELVAQKTHYEMGEEGLYPTPLSLETLLDTEGGEPAFGFYAESACKALTEALRGAARSTGQKLSGSKREKGTYVSVFGHAGCNHAIAHAVAAAADMKPSDMDSMISLELGDVEGVLVPLYAMKTKPAIHLKRPK